YFLPKSTNHFYLFLLILLITYLITSILFESLIQPFIILGMIPISFIGIFLTFYFFGFNFDQGGIASFVLISGLTVNASIFIVHGYNDYKKRFPDKNNFIIYMEAYKNKINPILITIFSIIHTLITFFIIYLYN